MAVPPPSSGQAWDSDPGAATNPDGSIEVFVRSEANLDLWQFYLKTPSDPNSWAAPRESSCISTGAGCWNTQPVFPTSDTQLLRSSDGKLQIYYRGFDGNLYYVQQSKAGDGTAYDPPVFLDVIVE